MPLVGTGLRGQFEVIFSSRPASKAAAGQQWAQAYVSYAAAAMTSTGGAAMNAMAGLASLTSAFTAALQQDDANGAAGTMASGVMAFWQAIAWVGAGSGVTTSPGNAALASALAAVFADTQEASASDKAGRVADAFDAGARLVIVMDTIPAAPSPIVVTGPIQ